MRNVLYAQEQWDDHGDIIYALWSTDKKVSMLTHSEKDVYQYAQQHELEIKWCDIHERT